MRVQNAKINFEDDTMMLKKNDNDLIHVLRFMEHSDIVESVRSPVKFVVDLHKLFLMCHHCQSISNVKNEDEEEENKNYVA